MYTSHSIIDILDLAVDALKSNTGLLAEVLQTTELPAKSTERTPDADLRLRDSGDRYLVQIKRHAQHANLGSLIDQIKRLSGSVPSLLAAGLHQSQHGG